MISQEQREAIRRKALEKIERISRIKELATITATDGREEWPVKIEIRADECFVVSGRGSALIVHVTETVFGYLVAVASHKVCGHVPADCNARDVQEYVGLDNQVDATTLAAAIRYLASNGFVPKHPAISVE